MGPRPPSVRIGRSIVVKPRLLAVAGARPNFMKVAPLCAAAARAGLSLPWVHTGQHYDPDLSDVFFSDLGLGPPSEHLRVGAGSAAEQTARILERLPPILVTRRVSTLVVVGDVTSTLAAALAAASMGVRVVHVEAGLRSFDDAMPEERNRVLTDRLSARLYVTEPSGVVNLAREGFDRRRVRLVGNPMIDALRVALPAIDRRARASAVEPGAVVTLHRPSNVDDHARLSRWCRALRGVSERMPVYFPVHPRTRVRLERFRLLKGLETSGVEVLAPLGYVEFLALVRRARVVLTDSGGLQEETSFLGVPCLTLRTTTERPLTLSRGTNRLVGDDPSRLGAAVTRALARPPRRRSPRRLWDGHASDRIIEDLVRMDV